LNTVVNAAPAARRPGSTWLVAGAIALAVGSAGAGWLMRSNAEPPVPVAPAPVAFEPMRSEAAAAPAREPEAPAPAPAVKRATPDKPAPVARTAPARQPRSAAQAAPAERTAPLPTQHAAVCADCGIVESVVPVSRKGEGSGVGAVAGGVLGAVVGNQVGGGNGRKAMTVLGAIGGGLAGHEIEKRAKAETVYEVKVRMEDGSVRTLTQSTQPVTGSRVIVEGDTLRPAATTGNAPRAIRTST
jgi:outer membrane lipoprotein SlyB